MRRALYLGFLQEIRPAPHFHVRRKDMNSKRQVVATKERNVTTYAEMWHTSFCLLTKGQEELRMSVHQFRASLIFTAFTLEAYFNHIGAKIFSCWRDLERLSPKEKLNVIAERLNIEIDYGKRPWQIMKNLFQFRNDIAHGKSIKIKSEKIVPLEAHSDDDFKDLFELTRWEKYCTEKNALRAREEVEAIVKIMQKAAGFENDFPFVSGFQVGGATVVEE
jgi:hypothetical protein